MALSALQPLQLLVQVTPKGLGAQGLAAHVLHQLSSVHAAAQRIDPRLKPLAELRIAPGL